MYILHYMNPLLSSQNYCWHFLYIVGGGGDNEFLFLLVQLDRSSLCGCLYEL